MANEWEVIGMPKSSIGAAFKLPITEPLISGPHNDFSLPESFSAELAALKGQTLLEQLAAELKNKTNVTEKAKVAALTAESLRDPFVDMMKAEALLTRTENGAVTYAASGNPLVDFFFQVVEGSQKEDIDSLLDQAWQHAPLETLQLVAHLRDVREGKGERERGWDAYIWLAQKHPRTLVVNLPEVVKVGFWKDLLQLLQRLCVGERGWSSAAKEEAARELSSGSNRKQRRLAKQKRLHEWQASLRRPADPETAAQQEAAGKGAGRPAHRMGPHRRQREMLAAEKRAAQAAEQGDGSDDSDEPSSDNSSLSGSKRKAPDAAMTDAPQNVEDEAMSPTKAARMEEGTTAKVESEEVVRMRQERANHFAGKLKADMERAAEARHQKALAAKQRVHEKLEKDVRFRALYAAVAHTFADQLRQDLADLQAGKQVSSLCAKWAPTPKQAHDKDTLIATAIAELLYPAEQFRRPGMSACDYTELARRSYAKEYLKPLREAARVPETKMAQGKWEEIDYERVASLCMKINKGHFSKHDKERLTEYLQQVKKGEKKIASGALKPHELVEEAMRRARFSFLSSSHLPSYLRSSYAEGSDSEGDGPEDEPDAEEEADAEEEVMEAQWRSYVDKLRQSGELSSCLAVADVSGSMEGQPMNVAIALSLLTAAVAKPPFNQLICTFSATPELHLVKGDTLVKQVQDVSRMKWGMNTNVNAVFDLILKKAVATRLKPEDMVSTIFIFSDMEFDSAYTDVSSGNEFYGGSTYRDVPSRYPQRVERTTYESVKAQYEAAGYKLPQVVFWNLRASDLLGQKSTPVQFNEKGVALVSGFSGQLLKLFMEKPGDVDAWKDEMSPETVMMEAIKGKGHYDSWRVVD